MDDFMCPVCFNDFDTKEFIPKVLECGHSLCPKCLSKILHSSSGALCPTCRANIARKEHYPTNYSLLNVSTKCGKVLGAEKQVKAVLSNLKRDVEEHMAISCNRTKFLESTLRRVAELEKFEEKNISVKRALRDISEIRKDLTSDTVQPESFETLNIADFDDEKEYLYEVYRMMKTGIVFAIQPVGKEHKYGEVTFLGNKIFMHCLSSFPEKPRNASYVWFQDMKRCWMKLNFGAFLQIPCNTQGLEALVEVELTKGCLVNQYIKLCTGEIGPSYKGAPYNKKLSNYYTFGRCILAVSEYMCDGNLKTGQIDYETYKVHTQYDHGEVIVYAYNNLGFYITKVNNTSSDLITGKVVSPSNLTDIICYSPEFPKIITDCGVYFHLN